MLQINLPAPSCWLLLADLALHLLQLSSLAHYDGPKVSVWSVQWFCVFWPDRTSLKHLLAWIDTWCDLEWYHNILVIQALWYCLIWASSYILKLHYNLCIQLGFHYSCLQMKRKNSSLKVCDKNSLFFFCLPTVEPDWGGPAYLTEQPPSSLQR